MLIPPDVAPRQKALPSPPPFERLWQNQPGDDAADIVRWKVTMLGDDIAWIALARTDAVRENPESGFFGVAPALR